MNWPNKRRATVAASPLRAGLASSSKSAGGSAASANSSLVALGDDLSRSRLLSPSSQALRFVRPDRESLRKLILRCRSSDMFATPFAVLICIFRYYYQLTLGCGRELCCNEHCFSCSGCPTLDAVDAAILAVRLAAGKSHLLCPGVAVELPKSLQFGQVALLVDAAVASGDEAPVASAVASVFESVQSLSWSFLVDECPRRATLHSSYLDYDAVRNSYLLLLDAQLPRTRASLQAAMESIVKRGLPCVSQTSDAGYETLRSLFIILSHPSLKEPEMFESVVKPLLHFVATLAPRLKEAVVEWLKSVPLFVLTDILVTMQQFVTIYVYQFRCIDDNVAAATKSLSLLNQANEATNVIPYTEFYNDAINELVDFQEDYSRWKDRNQASFSFCAHPFILDPSVKAKILQLDSASQMRTEILRGAIFRSLLLGSEQPYLVLKVSRENIIEDTLQQVLALTADLKKPIKVVFKGEEGVDEGGVQKEFFQLIVREMFDTKFGMFLHDSETNTVWFSQVQGNDREYFLVGLVLGLAIYNGVILDVHFPLVVYKKLVGQPVRARLLQRSQSF